MSPSVPAFAYTTLPPSWLGLLQAVPASSVHLPTRTRCLLGCPLWNPGHSSFETVSVLLSPGDQASRGEPQVLPCLFLDSQSSTQEASWQGAPLE